MPGQLFEYLERESSKRNLKKRIQEKDIELKEAIEIADKLKLTNAETDELLEGLSDKLKSFWKGMKGDKEGARADYAKALQDKQAAEYGKTGIGSAAKAAFGTATDKAKAFKLDAQIASKKAALERTPQGPAQQAINNQIAELQKQRDALTTEFSGQMAKAGAAQAEKAAAKQGGIDTKVAKLLARNLASQAAATAKEFGGKISSAASQGEAEAMASQMVNNIANSLKTFYKDSGIGLDKMPRGVL